MPTEDDLSTREIDVLRLIAIGSANKAIAAQLSIAEETVQEPRHEYTRQARRERPDACRYDRVKARNY